MSVPTGGSRRQVTRCLASTALTASPLVLAHPSVTRPVDLVAALLALAAAVAAVRWGPLAAPLTAGGALAASHAIGGVRLGQSLVVVVALCCVHCGLRHGLAVIPITLIAVSSGVLCGSNAHGQRSGTLAGVWAAGCLAGVVLGAMLGREIDRRAVGADLDDEARLDRARFDTWRREYPRLQCEADRLVFEPLHRAMGRPGHSTTLGRGPDPADADIESDLIDCFRASLRSSPDGQACELRVATDAAWIRMRAVVRGPRAQSLADDARLRLLHMLIHACRGVLTLTVVPGQGIAVHARVPRLRPPRAVAPGSHIGSPS